MAVSQSLCYGARIQDLRQAQGGRDHLSAHSDETGQ